VQLARVKLTSAASQDAAQDPKTSGCSPKTLYYAEDAVDNERSSRGRTMQAQVRVYLQAWPVR
jgi:hypothetical protein